MPNWTEPAQSPEVVDIDMPVIDLIAALTQEVADHVLAGPFGTAGGWDRDKFFRRRKLRVETGIDRVENSLAGIADHRVVVSSDLFRSDQTTLCLILPSPDRF